ncbi:hypothetical protein FHU29_001901 [Hoyosella altamirensis]|uniref:Uncharacterized protein n=1 Tax=Hoyosella altamirensis TaxID=616997 RepID=A0A839RL55_9ACTN|nr:hypothetical protein [Hoyosella altamirensis]MBB3037452.1 hypothetical protein [Hoyosella altamirensis]
MSKPRSRPLPPPCDECGKGYGVITHSQRGQLCITCFRKGKDKRK